MAEKVINPIQDEAMSRFSQNRTEAVRVFSDRNLSEEEKMARAVALLGQEEAEALQRAFARKK